MRSPDEIAAEIEGLKARLESARLVMWQAWNELSTIRARDGVPYQQDWGYGSVRSSVDEGYFSKVVDDCRDWLGKDAQPWPPKVESAAALRSRPDRATAKKRLLKLWQAGSNQYAAIVNGHPTDGHDKYRDGLIADLLRDLGYGAGDGR